MTAPPALPPDFLRFLAEFNGRRYWKSHETLEEGWRRHGSGFYQALILLASCYVHLERQNPAGARAQLKKTIQALRPFAPSYLGLDVSRLLVHCERLASALGERDQPAPTAIDPPHLEPLAAHLRGTEAELGDGGS